MKVPPPEFSSRYQNVMEPAVFNAGVRMLAPAVSSFRRAAAPAPPYEADAASL